MNNVEILFKRKCVRKSISLVLTGFLFFGAVSANNAEAAQKATLKLSRTTVTMKKGESVALKIKGKNLKKIKSQSWTTNKKKVATVSQKGKVTGKSAGKATVKVVIKYIEKKSAKMKKKTLKCAVTVTADSVAPEPVQSSAPIQTPESVQPSAPAQSLDPTQSSAPAQTSEPVQSPDSTETPDPAESPSISEPTPTGGASNFICGCDISSLIAEENSGVVYYNNDGEQEDLCKILADNGVNLIRLRVWNDPYDKDGNGYGGGNCDTEKAIEIGKRATNNGMSVMIDYHYSDFWADPSKQMCPKAWEGMTVSEKSEALYQYTIESLGKILDTGVDVSMVQIGNETTTGLAGEYDWKNITELMKAGSRAVRELSEKYEKKIKVVIQFTNPESSKSYDKYASTLKENEVDYDVFASSYYPFWHGGLKNLKKVLSNVVENYGKEVMIAEISYTYTKEDGDGYQNTITGSSKYETSEAGQISALTDCADVIKSLGESGLGICYWEPAWIPVPEKDGESRSDLWEKSGSGWASSFAAEYDPDDAGIYYGGSSWDNQALFDFEGHPLASLDVFNQIRGLGE